ncbi:MAG TPA: Holliday junction branch migration protein RuvA [Lachnospiraceae bacterium]|jgi:Holliday junction DNA helicase RuvA|nr:Holliday junction branch migration protein RuvA [Lachnospiraceae bacterium]HBY71001.1 Holliday junction branch migration protein RuvA [Lachnospiraceae bacterium]HCA70787.1 Holliday junction branch migration protein RuvA [Lachnospiraceae bacterium]HCM13428.1 Holliday junction branch migration protein RuvA [Lachnospiraceae bacterium]HCR40692.1 Holliday junction branch migration protein RuvA [Lachnospiraceae bacterium]
MISYLKGELAEIKENYVVVEVGNIGYDVFLPTSAIYELPPAGSSIKLYTYLHVREDAISFFGFLTKDDLEIFKLLITVNGIGPKGALGILSGISADELRFAVLAEDTKTLSKAPGIGKKTAAKLILELKDKFTLETAFEQRLQNQSQTAELSGIAGKKEETVQALTVLGYSASESLKMVNQVPITEDMTSEDILKMCLKKL